MVQSNAVDHFDTVVSTMSADEARACVVAINHHMNSARAELLRLYEGRGWVSLGYASWRECVKAEFELSKTRVYELLSAAQIEQRISALAEIGAIPERRLRPLAALTPMEQPLAWQEAQARSDGRPTARVVSEVVQDMLAPRPAPQPVEDEQNDVLDPPMEPAQAADIRKTRMNAGLFSSATPEWYTPGHILERVEAVFGQIDLDPCSNSHDPARANVPALAHWTIDDNGLMQPWHGKVYMNPPYGDEIGNWVGRMIGAFETGEIIEAIALLPARTDTAWFQPLFAYTACWIRGRLKFSGAENSAPFPSVVVYVGTDSSLFHDWFHTLGAVK